jgi:translation initiation factor IF-2
MAKTAKTTGLEKTRPPIVTVMGHIDHGKTTLLDKIRQTTIQSHESGGITQHIGAYQVQFKTKDGAGETVTFIDTPGHAAFAKMRARGAQVTDLVLLVVAADDGVKTQTKESLEHIKTAGVPLIVVINKIDAPNASVDSVKGQLAEIGLVSEDYGGKTTTVSVSAKTGEGIDELLEMIVLMGKLENLSADPEGDLEAVVIESCLDCKKGVLATVLVKNGTLRVGDDVWVEDEKIRIKALCNDQKKPVKQAGPSFPVELLGFKKTPAVGSQICCQSHDKIRKEEKVQPQESIDIFAEKKKEIPLVIKSDVEGTLEAVMVNIPDEIKVISCGAGDITDSDVFLAQSSGAQIFSFRAKVSAKINKLADESGVEIKQFEIIYDLLDEIEKQTLKLMDDKIDQQILGKAKIVAELEFDGKKIAGCKVIEGEIAKREKAYLLRGTEVLTDVKIGSLKHHREDISLAGKDQEFGAVFRPQVEFKSGDILVSFKTPKKD